MLIVGELTEKSIASDEFFDGEITTVLQGDVGFAFGTVNDCLL